MAASALPWLAALAVLAAPSAFAEGLGDGVLPGEGNLVDALADPEAVQPGDSGIVPPGTLPTPLDGGVPTDSTPAAPSAPDLAPPMDTWSAPEAALSLVGLASLAGAALWLGTRFRDTEDILRHDVRSKLYAYIQAHVGASLKEVTDDLALSTTNAVWHLRKLEEAGLVRSRKFNGAKVYYPTSGGVAARDLSIAGAALTNGNARTIMQFVQEHPGVHQREVARLLAVNHGTVRWHLKKLLAAGLLEEERLPGSTSYRVTGLGADALRMLRARTRPEEPSAMMGPVGLSAPGLAGEGASSREVVVQPTPGHA